MTPQEGRRIACGAVLSDAGFGPSRSTAGEDWYLSPWRGERTPSLKVDRAKNLWYDHGAGFGGNAVDLAVRLHGGLPQAMRVLERLGGVTPPPVSSSRPETTLSPEPFAPQDVSPLNDPGLLAYWQGRGIGPDLARAWLRQARVSRNGRTWLVSAWPNGSGGWELRGPDYKGASAPKAPTLARGPLWPSGGLDVYEGFSDFLAHLARLGVLEPPPGRDALVLNGLGLARRAAALAGRYADVALFLDRDEAGREAAGLFPGARDASGLYEGFKDLAEWHAAGNVPE